MQERRGDLREHRTTAGRPERPKRGHGEGSIDELAPGRWRGRLMLEGRRHAVYGASRQEVLDGLADLRRGHRTGLLDARATRMRHTVASYLRLWLNGRRGTVETMTWRVHEIALALHIGPRIGHLHLTKLTADDLRRLYGQLVRPQGSLSPKSVREVHGALRLALRQAVDDGLLARNVAALVKPPKREARTRQYVLSPEELRRLWRVAEPDRLRALWRIAALVPSRGGELRALSWDDLDERRGLLVIRRSAQGSGDGGRELTTKLPKTRAGTRAVPVDGDLLEVLRQHRDRQAEERRTAGARWCGGHDLIFCTRWGTPLLPGNVLRAFRGLLARAGLPTHYRVHDLRHTAVSSLLVAGVPLAEVAQLAGHANPQITASLYVHAVNRGGAAATAQLAAFYTLAADGDDRADGAASALASPASAPDGPSTP